MVAGIYFETRERSKIIKRRIPHFCHSAAYYYVLQYCFFSPTSSMVTTTVAQLCVVRVAHYIYYYCCSNLAVLAYSPKHDLYSSSPSSTQPELNPVVPEQQQQRQVQTASSLKIATAYK